MAGKRKTQGAGRAKLLLVAMALPALEGAACSGGGHSDSGGLVVSKVPPSCPTGPADSVTQAGVPDAARGGVAAPGDLHAAARKIDHYVANYGSWDPAAVATAKRAQLAIVHPAHAELTRAQVADIQAGMNPIDPSDVVLVLCYVSVGEDLRAAPLSDDQIRADPRFRGDGTGPRMDPRGPDADGKPLDGICTPHCVALPLASFFVSLAA